MRTMYSLLTFSKTFFSMLAVLLLTFLFPSKVSAQGAPPVPSSYQDLYTELDNYLTSFNAQLTANGSIPPYPTLWTGSLKAANSNVGPALADDLAGVQIQLQELKALGVQAIMVEVGFPVLYEPFLTSQGQSYTAFQNFYQSVATAVHNAGLKLIVENDTLLSNDVQAGWGTAGFYSTLNWDDPNPATNYQQARAAMAVTVVQTMQPDYLVVIEEPQTEADNTGQPNANTVSGSGQLLSTILGELAQTPTPNMQIGAGVITTQTNAVEFVQQYVTQPVNFIDMHIYSINDGYLSQIPLQIAATAAAAGLPLAMTECWLSKVRDSELNVLPMDTIRSRDVYSFWAPLDAYFVQTIQSLAQSTQMLFMDPYGSEYFFAYQTYNDSTENESPDQLLSAENALVSTANQEALFTSTGISYYQSNVVPADTTPPTTPTGLSGVSANPNQAALSWNASSDNVGVAGYYVYRNGQQIGQTSTAYYQDSGLTEATMYTYAVQAFDLGGNISAMSPNANVQTTNITPPTTPGNPTVSAVSCYGAKLTWTASQDNIKVTQYLLYWGLAPNALIQVATAGGSQTSYTNLSLSPGTANYFAVQAEDNDHNLSNVSTVVSVTTPTIPVPPSSVLATPSSGTEIKVTWSASTGGLPIGHYSVYKGTSPSSLAFVTNANGTSYTDTTVTPGNTYYYAIQATDTGAPAAQSGLSPVISATTYMPPQPPAGLTAAVNSTTRLTLNWNTSVSGGLPIANYKVLRGSSPSTMAQVATTTKTTYTDSTVSPQTTYYYAVQATDTGKPADVSALCPALAVTTYGNPLPPATVTATPTSSSKISLSWSASQSEGLAISTYRVYQGTSPSMLTQIAVTKTTSFTNTSLTPNTTYYYAVQASDTGGDLSTMSSPDISATTMPLPTAPTGVTATGKSSTQMSVSWLASSGTLAIAHYYVYRGTSPSQLSQVAITANTTYTDNSLSPGTTYYYAIQAGDTAQDLSPLSSPAVAGTTLP